MIKQQMINLESSGYQPRKSELDQVEKLDILGSMPEEQTGMFAGAVMIILL